MRSILVSLLAILLTVTPQSSSACCLFPFFPTYSAGYGWGFPGYGYAPAQYYGGYGGYGGCNSCGYRTPAYSAGYAEYSSYSNYMGAGSNCCGSSCGGCNNCVSEPFSSSKPVPDPISDHDRNDRDIDRDRIYNGPSDRQDSNDNEPADGFGRSNSLDRNSLDRDWDRSRDRGLDRGFGIDRGIDDGLGGGLDSNRGIDDGLRPDFDMNRSNRPDFDATPENSDGNAPVDHTTNKPPMNDPIDEEAPVPAPAGSDPDEEAPVGTETDPDDFLGPEGNGPNASARQMQLSQRETRSSHFNVVTAKRLAVSSRSRHSRPTQVSSSRSKTKTLHWISLPLPEGRNRL